MGSSWDSSCSLAALHHELGKQLHWNWKLTFYPPCSHQHPRFHHGNLQHTASCQQKESWLPNPWFWSRLEQSAMNSGSPQLKKQICSPASAQGCLDPRSKQIRTFCQSEGPASLSHLELELAVTTFSFYVNQTIWAYALVAEDCANQIYWWKKFTDACKARNIPKGIYCHPSTGEHLSGLGLNHISHKYGFSKCNCWYTGLVIIFFHSAAPRQGLPIGWTSREPGAVRDRLAAIYPWLEETRQETMHCSSRGSLIHLGYIISFF